jgi:hypothetical protein
MQRCAGDVNKAPNNTATSLMVDIT